jgi:hypothetical protein
MSRSGINHRGDCYCAACMAEFYAWLRRKRDDRTPPNQEHHHGST